MSSQGHRVLLAVPNPFVKTRPHQGSKPCLVWLTRESQYRSGRVIGSHYLLMVYDFKGRVKWHFELNVLNRMHRAIPKNEKPFVKCVHVHCRNTGNLCSCGYAPHSGWSPDHPPLDSTTRTPCPHCAHLR